MIRTGRGTGAERDCSRGDSLPAFRRVLGAAVVSAVVLSGPVPAAVAGQAGRAANEEGNRLYGEGRFDEAQARYLDALREAPQSDVVRFNNGAALYRQGDYQSALEAWGEAVASGDPELASDAWYNAGGALYHSGQLAESAEAYKQALRANPSHADAKHNLERVLAMLQRQPPRQQDQQQGEQEQDQEEKEDQRGQQDQQDSRQQQQPEQSESDEPHQRDQQSGQQQPPEQEDPREDQDSPQPREGEMTREEAERLLDAIEEDQDEVNRRPRTDARGVRPRKDW